MLFKDNSYNPLKEIFSIMPPLGVMPTTLVLDNIQRLLYKGGIIPETAEEFFETCNLLRELEREYNGKR